MQQQPNYSLLPQDIMTHISNFIHSEVQATDPKCYRSARRLQALVRGALTRMSGDICYLCNSTRAAPQRHFYWECDACHAAIAGGTNPITLYNIAGYDVEGYDRDGLDRAGYDYGGFDRHGYDQHGHAYDDDIHRTRELSPWSDGDGNELPYDWDFS